MKSCLKVLMLLAMAWAIPIANAAPSDYKLTVNTSPIWTVGASLVPANSAYSVAVNCQNEKLYMFNYGVLHETNGDAKTLQTVTPPSGVTYNNTRGYGVAHDDAGNVIVVPNAATESRTITHLTMFQGSGIGSQNKVVNIPDLTAVVYHISATGDVYSGTGEVWHVAPSTNKIRKLSFSGGTPASSWTEYTLNVTLSSMQVFVQKLSDGTLFLQDRSGHFYRVTLSGTSATCTEITLPSGVTGSPKLNMGATMYIWKEHELLFCHSNSTNYTSKFAVVDLTDNKVLATLDGIGAAGADGTGYSSWVHAVPDKDDASGKTLDIYSYKLVNGAAKYSITATPTDTENPAIVRYTTVQNDDTSFYRYVYVTDNVGVTRVSFPTWLPNEGQTGHQSVWHAGTSGNWTVGGQVYNWRVLINKSSHNNSEGPYTTHIYAYDAVGNTAAKNAGDFWFAGSPVTNLTATLSYADNHQNAVLSWTKPGGSTLTGYTISMSTDGGSSYTELITTTTPDVLTYTYENLTAETTFKVVANYSSTTSAPATYTVTPVEFLAPTNVTVREYSGFGRVVVDYSAVEVPDGFIVRYNVYRDGEKLNSEELTQVEWVDDNVPAGEHNYHVEAVYYTKDVNGDYTVQAVIKQSAAVTQTVAKQNSTLVSYTLEPVYNVDMWEFWAKAEPVNDDLPANFDPNQTTQYQESTKKWLYVDAENYRQGALFTDTSGKKWWLIMQRTKSHYATQDSIIARVDATDAANNCGILMLPAEDKHYSVDKVIDITDADVRMLTLPSTDQNGNDIAIKSGQSVGIAVDDAGNIFIRGYHKLNNWGQATHGNWAHRLMKGVVYKYDASTDSYTQGYTVDLSGITFDLANPTQSSTVHGRTDYYRLSGDIFNGGAKLYCSATNSKTMSVISLTGTASAVTAEVDRQIQYGEGVGAENYVFPVEKHPVTQVDEGTVFQVRGNTYSHISSDGTAIVDLLSGTGKAANSGGTTVRLISKLGATQLFMITPQSVYSKNIGSFVINEVYENNFENPLIPVANMVQTDTRHIVNSADGGNVNGNWLFAENAEDTANSGHNAIYIYQYVPGIRIAKYKLTGAITFFGSHPELEIVTTLDDSGDEISHFTATTTWSTPEDYVGSGNYDISYYKVELLDKDGNVIDCKNVDARKEGTVYETITRVDGDYHLKNYSLTFDCVSGITPAEGVTVSTGNASGHFVDDNTYTARITTVFDLTMHLNDPVANPTTDEQFSGVNSDEAIHSFTPVTPSGEVTVYTGKEGTNVEGAYRVEININNKETANEPVSHYELSYLADVDGDGVKETEKKIENFILVTSDKQTENQNIVPGTTVRNELPGQYLEESGDSYVCFFVDNREYVQPDSDKDEWRWELVGEEEEHEIPTNWEYKLTAVYANGNSLLRATPYSTMTPVDGGTTGEELLESREEATLKAFPIPAGSTLTVQSPKGIERITMLSSSGMVVKDIVGDGNTVMTINVDDLAAGYYMLRVNNLPIIKVVKK